MQFIHREGSNPFLTFTLLQSLQLQPFFFKDSTSLFDRFRYLSVIAMVLPGIFDPLSYFPQGGKDFPLPPWGKVGKGVPM
jgi:hypothetical protein